MPKVFFNISHSNNKIICCIDEREVGIDIEKIKEINLGIAKRFFTQNEIKYLTNIKQDEINNQILKVFTRKEAYAKAHGMNLFDVLSTFDSINQLKSFDDEYYINSYIYINNVI